MVNGINKILQIYKTLLKSYGPQGWWPLLELNNKKNIKITKSGSIKGYHPGDYTYPRTDRQRFEICCGAILTQNTSWVQVEKALQNLKRIDAIKPKAIKEISLQRLKAAIKPAGYFNQKAKKLKKFADFYLQLRGRTPTRDELLSVWGVGKETADSILLYAYKVPRFVVDAYTRRIFTNLRLIDKKVDYDKIKTLVERNLTPNLKVYQEFHALLVEHAKRYYGTKADYGLCPLCRKQGQIRKHHAVHV